jgi:2-oxoglutarate ferredoxin oxidoreductase subunit alpha
MLPDFETLPVLEKDFRTDPKHYTPYSRDLNTLTRDWVVPGTPGLEHRIGGLEKDQYTGDVSYDPVNHETMVLIRDAKIRRIAKDLPPLKIIGPSKNQLLVLCWGSTYGAALSAVENLQQKEKSVSMLHLQCLYPFHEDLGNVLKGFEKILIPEMNLGQLSLLIRSEYLVETISKKKIQGKPFMVSEIREKIESLLTGD